MIQLHAIFSYFCVSYSNFVRNYFIDYLYRISIDGYIKFYSSQSKFKRKNDFHNELEIILAIKTFTYISVTKSFQNSLSRNTKFCKLTQYTFFSIIILNKKCLVINRTLYYVSRIILMRKCDHETSSASR